MRSGPLRVAALGSSGTYGFCLSRERTWPLEMQRLSRVGGRPVEVSNFASPGLPLAAYAERLMHLREVYRPDMVVLQLPVYSRLYLGLNGTQRRRERDLTPAEVFGWTGVCDATTRASPTRVHLNRLLAVEGSAFFHLLEPWFYPPVVENNPAVSKEEFLAFARFWANNVAESDLQHVQHGKEILFLQVLLDRWELPYLMFDWHAYNSRLDRCLGPFRELIDFTRYVREGALTATEFVARHGDARAGELFVDGHGHMTAEGHRQLAARFLLPAFLPAVDAILAEEETCHGPIPLRCDET